MLHFISQRSFLFVLMIVLLSGIAWPESTKPIAQWLPADAIVAVVTFVMADAVSESFLNWGI
jgi:hypothetical protein